MKKTILIFLFLTSFLSGTFSQSNLSFQSVLDSIQVSSNYPGIAFTHINEQNDVTAFASGWADKENKVRMTPDHKLHGGSTGKTVVSALVMQLIEEEKISLEDSVSKYLGSYEWYERLPNANYISIKNLLQHSSGIIRYEFKDEFLSELKRDPSKVWRPEELLSYVFDEEPPFKAGEGFTYSDTNYILLGMIIERVTNNDFYSEAEKRILKPLGITSFSPTKNNSIAGMAQGYYIEGSEYALGFKAPFLIDGKAQNNMQFEWTGGGYFYKNVDFAKLLKSIYEGEVFSLEELGEQFFDFINAPEIQGSYGLGVIKYEFPGLGTFIGHSGFFPGYYTMGFYHTETKQVFTMQINSTETSHLQKFTSDYLFLVNSILAKK